MPRARRPLHEQGTKPPAGSPGRGLLLGAEGFLAPRPEAGEGGHWRGMSRDKAGQDGQVTRDEAETLSPFSTMEPDDEGDEGEEDDDGS